MKHRLLKQFSLGWSKGYGIYIASLLLILLINIPRGKLIFGLDNISPFFSLLQNFNLVFNSHSVFAHGPEIFNLPVQILGALNINSAIISYVSWGLPLIFGGTFYLTLILLIHSSSPLPKKDFRLLDTFILLLLILGNLVTIWTFSQPIMIFTSVFVAFPALLYLYLWVSTYKKFRLKEYVILIVALIYAYTSSLNLLAFILLNLQVVVIGAVVIKVYFKTIKSTSIANPVSVKRGALFIGGLMSIWLLLMQGILIAGNGSNNIIYEGYTHFTQLKENEFSDLVTTDLRSAELQNNYFLNSARFAGGWMELHDANGIPVFPYYSEYLGGAFFRIVGIIPLICAGILIILRKNAEDKWILGLAFIAVALLSSRYFYLITEGLPYLNDAFRWLSSKVAPSLLFLGTLSTLEALHFLQSKIEGAHKSKRSKSYRMRIVPIKLLVILLLFLYAFPWWTGTIFSYGVTSDLPKDYFAFEQLPSDSKILYLPPPQKLYFRQYSWGYYGSDFIKYLADHEIYDTSALDLDVTKYSKLVEHFEKCNMNELLLSGVDYIVYDRGITSAKQPPECYMKYLVQNTEFLYIYRLH